MEAGPWIAYWYQVLLTCFEWVLDYYPIPTIVIALVVTVATMIGFRFLGQHNEAKNTLWTFVFGLLACCIMFIVMVLVVGPYLHLQKREKEIKSADKVEYDKMEMSKTDQAKTLNDTVDVLQNSQKTLQDRIQTLENEKSVIPHERDRLCENKVAFKIKNHTLPDKPYRQILTISKPRTPLYKFRIISTSNLSVDIERDMLVSGGVVTDDGEPITEVSVRSGIKDDFAFPIYSDEPFDIKCIGRMR